jgi:hypothetical protein
MMLGCDLETLNYCSAECRHWWQTIFVVVHIQCISKILVDRETELSSKKLFAHPMLNHYALSLGLNHGK